MSKNRKLPVKRVLLSALLLCAVTFLLCCVLGALVQAEVIPVKMAVSSNRILVELLLFLVCYLAVRKVPQSRLPAAVAIAAVFIGMRMALKLLLFPETEWNVGWPLLFSAAAALIAGCLASMKKQRRR